MRVRLGGPVMDDDTASLYRRYGYVDQCSPGDVRDALAKCPAGEELVFEINSGGGSVFAGFEMYNVLRAANRETVCEIQSVAASAASVIAMGCTTVRISPVATMMIHRSSSWADGNAQVMEQTQQMLQTIDDGILAAYTQKCSDRCDEKRLRDMMENERFLTGQECVELGLADELLFQQDDETAMTRAAVAMCGGMGQILGQLPTVAELMRWETAGANNSANGAEPNEKEEGTMTLAELESQEPKLLAEIRQAAAQQERDRLSAIDNVAMAGFEDLIAAAKTDPNATAETVAVQIINRQKAQGIEYLKNVGKDVTDGHVDEVRGSTNADDELQACLDEAFPDAK